MSTCTFGTASKTGAGALTLTAPGAVGAALGIVMVSSCLQRGHCTCLPASVGSAVSCCRQPGQAIIIRSMSDIFRVKRPRLLDVAGPLDDRAAIGEDREFVALDLK